MSLDRFRAFALTQVGRAYRPTLAPLPPLNPRAVADAITTAKILQVGEVREVAPRTAPIPLPATYPEALPLELERIAEVFTLAAQGRLSEASARHLVWPGASPIPNRQAISAALDYLRRWESYYADLMESECPPGMRCPDVGLCPWHRKTLRRWFDRLHPVVRAAATPQTFEAVVAPLVKDVPTRRSP